MSAKTSKARSNWSGLLEQAWLNLTGAKRLWTPSADRVPAIYTALSGEQEAAA